MVYKAFADLNGATISLTANTLLGAASTNSPSSPFGKSGARRDRRESTLFIHANGSARTLSHPNEQSVSPVQWPLHRNSHQNSLVTTAALNYQHSKSPNSPRSPRSAHFFSSPNATPTSKTSSTFQIISNALDAVVNLPYKLGAGENASTRGDNWSPNEKKRQQQATRSTVYYSPETGAPLQNGQYLCPSRTGSGFDFSHVKTQQVTIIYEPKTGAFSAVAQQPFDSELLSI